MDKYKLIKTYPNSPELGMVVCKGTVGSYDKYPDQYGSLDNTMFFTVKEIENYPEFWEKVKDYEIISIRYQENNEIYTWDGEYFSYQNSVISLESTLKGFIGSKNTGYNIYIHSVKRLSDNVIFTVRDKVKQSNVQHNNTFTITRFEFDVNNEHLLVIGNGGIKLHKIEHCKTPLFTTEDGVEIFEGNEYFELITPGFHNKPCIWNILPNKARPNIIYQQECSRKHGRIWFSSKEKAEEYILMNKPCLSINEIGSIIGRFNNTVYIDLDLMNKKLKELVKDKI
jgi:hypothetical protein